ncbi:MAG: ATP-binding protein [Oscillospiraceae bacterium]|nr:ATP-binding protein [Oscillospiraceae bacterium]
MTKKMFRSAFLVGISVLVISSVLFFGVLYRYYEAQVFSELSTAADYISHGMALSGESYLRTLQSSDRVTWIDTDGTVLYDSAADAAAMENHLGRAEVQEALTDGFGQSSHVSETLLQRTLYYALRMDDGTVLRVSCAQHAMSSMMGALISPILWITVLVLLLSAVLAFRLARQITGPINEIDPDNPACSETYPELSPLVTRLSDQNRIIRAQMAELSRRQQDFAAIADNMSEGFLLLDRKLNILSCNQSALRLLDIADSEEKNLRSSSTREIVSAAETALSGSRSEQLLTREDRTWQVIASPVTADGQVPGAAVILMDVTEREQREALRREFSANVSHELKTPLTSITGFAELMKDGLVPPEKAREFAGDIYHESRRLIDLVDDILNLSKLDENSRMFEREDVDLSALCRESLDSLRSAAEKKQVSLQLVSEPVHIHGVWPILSEMVYNLCDNAIKYNKDGGSVTVTVRPQGSGARLVVADTGIGIPYTHQSRVFERFYRVDKSHSKEIGGTGLGLSIVKHGAQYHDARVALQSEPGVGTTVTLTFLQ